MRDRLEKDRYSQERYNKSLRKIDRDWHKKNRTSVFSLRSGKVFFADEKQSQNSHDTLTSKVTKERKRGTRHGFRITLFILIRITLFFLIRILIKLLLSFCVNYLYAIFDKACEVCTSLHIQYQFLASLKIYTADWVIKG